MQKLEIAAAKSKKIFRNQRKRKSNIVVEFSGQWTLNFKYVIHVVKEESFINQTDTTVLVKEHVFNTYMIHILINKYST